MTISIQFSYGKQYAKLENGSIVWINYPYYLTKDQADTVLDYVYFLLNNPSYLKLEQENDTIRST